jgi:hypothetical protein
MTTLSTLWFSNQVIHVNNETQKVGAFWKMKTFCFQRRKILVIDALSVWPTTIVRSNLSQNKTRNHGGDNKIVVQSVGVSFIFLTDLLGLSLKLNVECISQ